MTKRYSVVLTFLLALLIAAPAVAQWAIAPEIKVLHAAARVEGEVVIWGPRQRELAWIPRAFAQMFPGIAVKLFADADVANRAMLEARTGQHQIDVFWHDLTAATAVARRGLATTNDWPLFGVSEINQGLEARFGHTNNLIYVIAYNTEQVKSVDVPGTWNDLLDEKYAGKLVSSLYQLPPLIGWLGQEWGLDRSVQFARDLLVRSGILMTRAPRDTFLKSGERQFAIGEFDTLPRLWAADGLPIGFKVPEPVVAQQFGTMVMANALHPNAARLLAGWLASREGKAARERANGEIDYRPGTENAEANRLLGSGVRFIHESTDRAGERETLVNRVTQILSARLR